MESDTHSHMSDGPEQRGQPRRPRITIRDVAELAGVSTSAVSHAFNGRTDIGKAARQRIMEAAAELNWRPAAAARALAAAGTRTVAYVVRRDPDQVDSDPFFLPIIAGIQSALAAKHYNLLVRIVKSRDDELETYRMFCQGRQVDGFFLVDHQVDDARYPIITAAGLSAVAIGRPHAGCPFRVIASDPGDTGLSEAIMALLERGHQRIAYVGQPENFSYSLFRRQHVEEQVALAGQSLIVRNSEPNQGSCTAATTELLMLQNRPTAIIYGSDLMALWGMAAADSAGLAVPQDLSITGHDDAPFAALVSPSLTSVHQDVLSLADVAARTLLCIIEGDPIPTAVVPSTSFVLRESIGQAPVRT